MEFITHAHYILKKNGLQFAKFLLIGLLNTFIGYSIFIALSLMNLGPSSTLFLTYLIAVPINFFTTGKIIFSNNNWLMLLPFIAAYIIIYGINLLLLQLFIYWHYNQIVAQALILPFIAVLSFLIFKKGVFRNH